MVKFPLADDERIVSSDQKMHWDRLPMSPSFLTLVDGGVLAYPHPDGVEWVSRHWLVDKFMPESASDYGDQLPPGPFAEFD